MLHSTRGIALHTIKYAETSIIVKVYTDLFGLQSYMVKGSRNPKSKIKAALFQSLTLLDLVVYHKERHTIQSLKEAHLAVPFQFIPFDVMKSSVVLFMNELVYKVIREEEPNPELFSFLWQTCVHLDETHENIARFPVGFMVSLMPYLGISPQNNHSSRNAIFNMREGYFQEVIPNHPDYLNEESSLILSAALESRVTHRASRINLLEILLRYYSLHIPGFTGLKSHHILHDVLA